MLFVDDTVLVAESVEMLNSLMGEFGRAYEIRKPKVNEKCKIQKFSLSGEQ